MAREDQQKVDVFIIGGGQAGIPLAHALAGAGRSVALAERKYLGGTCVNYGCTPTKAVLASAQVAQQARRASDYGLVIDEVEVDFPAVLERARTILMRSRNGLEDGLADADNVELVHGHTRLAGVQDGGFSLKTGSECFLADDVVINSGTRSLIPPIDGLDGIEYLHAGNWLGHDVLPEHLIVIGGGYVGLEMAQFYRRMGSAVSLVQSGSQIAPREDEEVAAALQDFLEGEGIAFYLGQRAESIRQEGGQLAVTLQSREGRTEELRGTDLFIATGRRPNTDDLGLKTIGLSTDDRGYLDVDEHLATEVKGVWAAGDVRGGPMFTHTSWDDYRILRSQLIGAGDRTTNRVVPYALFTEPELGRVGLTEKEARAQGRSVLVGRYDMNKNGKANEIGRTEGFVKVVVDAETDHILGAAVLAAEAGELVHTYSTLMNAGVPHQTLRDAVQIHPTLNEALQSALTALD